MRFPPLIPLAFCTSGAIAQNSTSSNTTTCKETFDLKIPLNASALVEVPSSGTPPWYLGVTFGDQRNSSRPDQAYYGYISTPTNSTAFACTRLTHKVLPATGTGANGECAGVLSDNCIDFLRRTSALTQSDAQNKNCPNAPSASDMEKACPPLAGSSASTHLPLASIFCPKNHLNSSNPVHNHRTLISPKATAPASSSPTPHAPPPASLAHNSLHQTTTTSRSSASPASATTKATVWIRVSSPGMTSTLSSRCCGLCQRLRTARVGRVWFVLGRRGWRGGVGCQVRIRVGRGSWR